MFNFIFNFVILIIILNIILIVSAELIIIEKEEEEEKEGIKRNKNYYQKEFEEEEEIKLEQQQQEQLLKGINILNPNKYLKSQTINYNINNPNQLINQLIYIDNISYFILSDLHLLFTNNNMVQQINNIQLLNTVLTISIYLNNTNLIKQYTIDISSVPLYNDYPTLSCNTNTIDDPSTCNYVIDACGPAQIDCTNSCSYKYIPTQLIISSSQSFSFSPYLLIYNNISLNININSSSSQFYFNNLYLTFTLLNF